MNKLDHIIWEHYICKLSFTYTHAYKEYDKLNHYNAHGQRNTCTNTLCIF